MLLYRRRDERLRARVQGKGASDVRLGGDGPKPPPALAQAVIGMKKGGQRSLIVPSELGYPKVTRTGRRETWRLSKGVLCGGVKVEGKVVLVKKGRVVL